MTHPKKDRKELAREYVQTHRPMGVYQVRNLANGKLLVGSSMDLNGTFNKLKFMLTMGGYPNKELEQDWKTYGEDSFAFEVLERIKPREEIVQNREELAKYKEELKVMEQIWLEELQPYGERGYNKKRRTGEMTS